MPVHDEYRRRLADANETEAEWFADLYDVGWPDAPHRVIRNSTAEDWEAELNEVLTFKTLTAGVVTASKHKIASNIFLHAIRHWGQIATVLRQNGFTDQWPHDMLLSDVMT